MENNLEVRPDLNPISDSAGEPENQPVENKSFIKKWKYFLMGIGLLVVLVGVFGVVFSVRAVRNLSESLFVLKVAEVLNLPVVRVNGIGVPYALYAEDLKTLKKFYAGAGAAQGQSFTDEQISDQALSRLIVNSLMKDLSREYKLSVTEEEISSIKARLFAQYESEDQVEMELKNQYGWDLKTYEEKIVRPLVLEQKVSEFFTAGKVGDVGEEYDAGEQVEASHILFRVEDESQDETVRAEALKVLQRAYNGEDFGALAREFSSDSTKDTNGDLGWFGRGAMVPEFEEAVFALQPGEVGDDLVKTDFGYHIVKVNERRQAMDFNAYFSNLLKNASIEFVTNAHDPFEELRNAGANSQS